MAAALTASDIVLDTWYRIEGEKNKVYVAVSFNESDGSITLHGGSRDPGGHRGSRTVMPHRLIPAKAPEWASHPKVAK